MPDDRGMAAGRPRRTDFVDQAFERAGFRVRPDRRIQRAHHRGFGRQGTAEQVLHEFLLLLPLLERIIRTLPGAFKPGGQAQFGKRTDLPVAQERLDQLELGIARFG